MVRYVAVLAMGLLLVATPPGAVAIPVAFDFVEAAWSGWVSFDGASGLAFGWVPGVTAYGITDMEISDGVHTWTEDDLLPGFSDPPLYGLLVDRRGRAGLLALALDESTLLSPGVCFDADLICDTALFVFGDPSGEFLGQSAYTAFVPAPSTLLLLGSGLAGLGALAWRRRR